jgi:hypothetical protein
MGNKGVDGRRWVDVIFDISMVGELILMEGEVVVCYVSFRRRRGWAAHRQISGE